MVDEETNSQIRVYNELLAQGDFNSFTKSQEIKADPAVLHELYRRLDSEIVEPVRCHESAGNGFKEKPKPGTWMQVEGDGGSSFDTDHIIL